MLPDLYIYYISACTVTYTCVDYGLFSVNSCSGSGNFEKLSFTPSEYEYYVLFTFCFSVK